MRITHVTQPTQAGVAAVVAALAADQAAAGHHTTVICPTDEIADGPLRRLDQAGQVHLVRWQATRSPGPSSLAEARSLAPLLRAAEPDVVVLHSAKAGLAGRLALRGRVRTVFVPHAWSFEAAEGLVRRASTRWELLAQRWTDVTVCVSADEQRRGAEVGLGPARTLVIPNGVDTDRFSPGSRSEARTTLGLPDVPTVVCVGRLARQKGQDRLVAAWPAVRRVVPEAALVLVGDGPDRQALAEQAGDGVHLVGATSDPRAWFHAADVVAFPSRWEAGALVPMEAMACARSVVAVEVTGVRDTLAGTGTVVAAGDDPASCQRLADALTARLGDPAGTTADGTRARAAVMQGSSLSESLRRWAVLLEDVTRESPETTGHPR